MPRQGTDERVLTSGETPRLQSEGRKRVIIEPDTETMTRQSPEFMAMIDAVISHNDIGIVLLPTEAEPDSHVYVISSKLMDQFKTVLSILKTAGVGSEKSNTDLP